MWADTLPKFTMVSAVDTVEKNLQSEIWNASLPISFPDQKQKLVVGQRYQISLQPFGACYVAAIEDKWINPYCIRERYSCPVSSLWRNSRGFLERGYRACMRWLKSVILPLSACSVKLGCAMHPCILVHLWTADVPVRAELLDQFPHIALFISENRHLFPTDIPSPFSVCLLPLLLRHMKDISNQVAESWYCRNLTLLASNRTWNVIQYVKNSRCQKVVSVCCVVDVLTHAVDLHKTTSH